MFLFFKCVLSDTGHNEVDQHQNVEENSETFPLDGHVYILTDKTFGLFLEQNPTTLVEFYAPWCGHCKSLAPEYEKAAKNLFQQVPFAKIDATVESEAAKKFNINGYPTLKLWKDGLSDPIDYDGGREATDIESWVRIKIDPNYKPLPEHVVTLTIETFDEFINDKPIVLVEFFAPWCGHCKSLAPEYEKAAAELKEHNIPLAKVDATAESRLAEEYDVKGYPTLKIFRNGRRFDYDGPRTASGIIKYMIEQSKPASKLLRTIKEIHNFTVLNDVTIIGFFESESIPLFDAFNDASEKTRGDFATAYVLDPSIRRTMKAEENKIFIYYPEIFWSKYESKFHVLPNQDATSDDIIAFWKEHSTPLVGQRTQMNAATRYTKLPLVVIYYSLDFSLQYREGTQFWRNKVLDIAHKYKDKGYNFAISDEEEFSDELAHLGLGSSGLEHNVVVFGVDGKKYPMLPEDGFEEELSENLELFLKAISKGKVKPYVKSQPIPKEDQSSSVKSLVANNFAKIVNDENKDVLVEFYAPWCGHCKAFEPKYKQFAAKYTSEQPNLVVAKFDATANDIPENFVVEGFPTIYFVPSGKKNKPIKYSGNRDLDDLTKFVRENAVRSFKQREEL